MTSHLPLRGSLSLLLSLLFALSALGASRTASASPTSCTQNSDCSKGFTCQAVGASACPAYACAAMTGTDVDAQSCPPPPACDPQVIMGCMPGPCSTDSDCATGMVCYADSYTTCASPAPTPSCPPNADCAFPAVDAGACTTTTVKSCVPRYDLPCTVSSDCGDGFTCVPDTITACSGGGSAGSGGSGGAPTTTSGPAILVDAGTIAVLDASSPQPPSCTTTTGSTSSCQVNTIPCTTSNDCPSTWTCVAQPQPVSNICAGPASFDGAVPTCGTPDPTPAPTLCEPPYEGLGVSPGGASLSGGGGAPVPALAQNAAADGGTSGSSSAPTGATGATGGCQVVAPGASPGAASLFTLLGLTALTRRRRSRSRS